MTARITEREAVIREEVFAPRIELFWDPATNDGKVVFHMIRKVTVEGVEVARTEIGRMEHPFDAILGRTFEVPDGQGGLIPVPTMLLMGTIKTAFDTLYNERVAPPPPPPPPTPPPQSEPEPDLEPDPETDPDAEQGDA